MATPPLVHRKRVRTILVLSVSRLHILTVLMSYCCTTAGITSKIQVTFQTHRQVDGDDGEHDLELSKLPVVSEDEKDSAVIAADEVRLPSAAFRGSERSPAIYITDDRHTRLDSHYEAKV